jgi:tyrosinase
MNFLMLSRFAATVTLLLLLTISLNSCEEESGPDDQTQLRLRKSITELSQQEKSDYVSAVLKLKTTVSPYNSSFTYYDQFVYWHLQAFKCDNGAAHMGPAFLPWHRQFLLLYERALNEVLPGNNITVPYWDFTDPASESVLLADDFMGGWGDPAENYAVKTGPFRKGEWVLNILDPLEISPIQFPYITRGKGTYTKGGYPTAAEISYMLGITNYDVAPWNHRSDTAKSFRNYLEGWRGNFDTADCILGWMEPIHKADDDDTTLSSKMHNVVHLIIGGVWQDSVGGTITAMTSPNDPIFFNLHANIDRLWSAWEEKHPNTYEPTSGAMSGQNRYDNMWPYITIGQNITPDSMLTTSRQGYKYSTLPK